MPEFREDLAAFLRAFGVQKFLYAAAFAKQQWPDAQTRDAFIQAATNTPTPPPAPAYPPRDADSLANQGVPSL